MDTYDSRTIITSFILLSLEVSAEMTSLAQVYNSLTPDEQQQYLNGPGLDPPPGIESNFDNHPNGNSVLYSTSVACIVVGSVFILLTIYTRIYHTKHVHLEDYFAIIGVAGWCCVLGLLYSAVYQYGLFVHQWDLRRWEVFGLFRTIYFGAIANFVTMATIKAAIVLEWCRIFVPAGVRNKLFWTCYAVAFLNFVASLANMLVLAFGCDPPQKYWNIFLEGNCLDGNATAISASVVNLFFDLVILVLPQRVIWNLQLTLRKKLGVSILFAVGMTTCVIASFQIVFSVRFSTESDSTYNVSSLALLCLAQQTAGILIYCMPVAPKALVSLTEDINVSASRILKCLGISTAKANSPSDSKHGYGFKSYIPPRHEYQEMDEVSLTTLPSSTTATSNQGGNRGRGLQRR
ncbi:hypothetical protein GGR54DRAFT_607399 [Hypoxylon sp. NC1633]|nr:hypothetical protein GGR54DRAFT_607399 [Hypoxylon sp. NC1633]